MVKYSLEIKRLTQKELDVLGRIPVLKARMNADLHMADDLKNTGKGKHGFDNLAVGYYKDGKLHFIGKVKNGFVPATREEGKL